MDILGLLSWSKPNGVGCSVEEAVVDEIDAVGWNGGVVFRGIETATATLRCRERRRKFLGLTGGFIWEIG